MVISGDAMHAPSSYCNGMQIYVTQWDVTLEFFQLIPLPHEEEGAVEGGVSPVIATGRKLIQRIVMSPQHAKAFLEVLGQNVAEYEKLYGEVPLLIQPDEGRSEGGRNDVD